MTENVLGGVVAVLPDQRNRDLVLILEGVRPNGTSVGALEISLGCPTAEVGFHFDYLLPELVVELAPTEPACWH